ncbi:MAG: lysine--tRNA ligase [Verrucomicrobiota bacterium]|nr:lysine--tRNA ligase [Verrucomicrobiota bacterium]
MEEPNSLIEQRKSKLAALRAQGLDPFKNKFSPTEKCAEARENYVEGREVAVAGRITAHREMGKSIFIDVKDQSGRIQIYAQKNILGDEQWNIFTHLDLGDFIGVKGTMFTTKTGEISVKLGGAGVPTTGQSDPPEKRKSPFVILGKALRPPPEKWHGVVDTEIRYRQRYLDLMANDEVKNIFLMRSAIVREIRNFFHSRDFVEVETPLLQPIPGGAAAQPFKTFHNALGSEFYLRIAIELYHKRLLVGGIDKIFEIGKNFRNEGLSRKHNPEFTMLEAYEAFGDYATMMETVESLITSVAQKVLGTLKIEKGSARGPRAESGGSPDSPSTNSPSEKSDEQNFRRAAENGMPAACAPQQTIDLTRPWKRARYKDLIREKAGADWFEITSTQRRERAQKLGAEIGKEYEDFEVTGAIFEKLIEPTLIQPIFVTHLPKELVPLAKLSSEDPTTVEVFECCINGAEIAPGYTEQNDSVAQRETLEHQAGGEQQKLDEDFLVALEHGMPPAGGIGIGIDRLCMMLLGQESIRDVILFPQMKPK